MIDNYVIALLGKNNKIMATAPWTDNFQVSFTFHHEFEEPSGWALYCPTSKEIIISQDVDPLNLTRKQRQFGTVEINISMLDRVRHILTSRSRYRSIDA